MRGWHSYVIATSLRPAIVAQDCFDVDLEFDVPIPICRGARVRAILVEAPHGVVRLELGPRDVEGGHQTATLGFHG